MKMFWGNWKIKPKWTLKKDLRRSTEHLKDVKIGSTEHKDTLRVIEQNSEIQNGIKDSTGKWIQVISTAAVSIGMTFAIIYKDQVGELIDRSYSAWQQRHHRP